MLETTPFVEQASQPMDPIQPGNGVAILEPSYFDELKEALPLGSILFPGDLAYEQAAFIGNLLHRLKTPSAIVKPEKIQDIKEIVNFCRSNDLQLSVKNGGHSYEGYCLNEGGVVMDMSNLNHVHVNDDNTEVTIQAGAVWKEVYQTLVGKHKANIVIGGLCNLVGVSGFTLGGGVSPFSRSYGLGIDNVTEMTVVTAYGEVVTLNDHETDSSKQDLFWALCGGGGGNFAVLVEFKSKVWRLRDEEGMVSGGTFTWDLDKSRDRFNQMLAVFNNKTWPNELTADARWIARKEKGRLGQMTFIYNGGRDECQKAIAPLLAFNPDEGDIIAKPWPQWELKSEGFDPKSTIFHHHTSFIFAQGDITPLLVGRINAVIDQAYEKYCVDGRARAHFLWSHIGGKTASRDSSATPFPWRQGVYISNLKLVWYNEADNKTMEDISEDCKKQLGPFAIDKKAAYINYIDATVDNWQDAYYGDNYPRLQRVKSQWDPNDFFHFDQSIEPEGVIRPHNQDSSNSVEPAVRGAGSSNFRVVACARSLPASKQLLLDWSKYSMPSKYFKGLPDNYTDQEIYELTARARRERQP